MLIIMLYKKIRSDLISRVGDGSMIAVEDHIQYVVLVIISTEPQDSWSLFCQMIYGRLYYHRSKGQQGKGV